MGYNLNLIKCKTYEEYLNDNFTKIDGVYLKKIANSIEGFFYKNELEYINPITKESISISGDFLIYQYDDKEIILGLTHGILTISYIKGIELILTKIGAILGMKCFGDEGEEYESEVSI